MDSAFAIENGFSVIGPVAVPTRQGIYQILFRARGLQADRGMNGPTKAIIPNEAEVTVDAAGEGSVIAFRPLPFPVQDVTQADFERRALELVRELVGRG